jgi:hypothetical protein
MIPLLIYTLFKKFRNQKWTFKTLVMGSISRSLLRLIVFLSGVILLLLIPAGSKNQTLRLNYKITKGGDVIGWLKLEKDTEGNTSEMLMVSEIKTRFVIPFTVSSKESSFFVDGRLVYSSQFRKTNGSTKLDKKTTLANDKYVVSENGEKQELDIHFIGTNLLSLYFQEPTGINFVYCDKHEHFSEILKLDDGGYKVKFPDGNSNIFYYCEGICSKIKINHSFYSAEILLDR